MVGLLLWDAFFVVISYDAFYISRRSLISEQRIAWSDITSVKYNDELNTIVVSDDINRIRVISYTKGIVLFLEMLATKVDRKLLQEIEPLIEL